VQQTAGDPGDNPETLLHAYVDPLNMASTDFNYAREVSAGTNFPLAPHRARLNHWETHDRRDPRVTKRRACPRRTFRQYPRARSGHAHDGEAAMIGSDLKGNESDPFVLWIK
jgi:hypothetical protein